MVQEDYSANNKVADWTYTDGRGLKEFFAVSVGVCPRPSALVRKVASFFTLALLAMNLQFCAAESVAARNNKGNRLFENGKFTEAEKAYLSAQVESPGKPEILYNLGNSLVKQKKYREGIQSLGQSISKGDKKIKQKGWYNVGNAFFSACNYRDAAASFIEALKLEPADKEAKHNLELALLKLKQQEENSQKNQKNEEKQDSKESAKDKSSKSSDARQQPKKQNEGAGTQQNQKANSQEENRPVPHEGSLTKQRATQLLDAVQNQEIEEQRRLMTQRARQRAGGKDW